MTFMLLDGYLNTEHMYVGTIQIIWVDIEVHIPHP
jgi:hypothetical protein